MQVSDICRRMAWYMDQHAWEKLSDVLAEEILLDYSSLNGAPASVVPRKELVETWRRSLSGYAAVQHLISNELVDIDGERADVSAMFIATHHLPNPHGGPVWTVGGQYRYGLLRTEAGWRISELAMTISWSDGNRNVRDLAIQAAG